MLFFSSSSILFLIKTAFEVILMLKKDLKKSIILFYIASFFAAILEVVGVGSILPFLIVLVDPQRLSEIPGVIPLITLFNYSLESRELVVIIACIAFGLLFLTNAVRVLVLYGNSIIASRVYTYLSTSLFNYYINRDYIYHVQNNSSTLREKVFIESQRVGVVLYYCMQLFSNLFIILFLALSLVFILPFLGFVAILGLFAIYAIIYKLTEFRVRRNGVIVSENNFYSSRLINESFSGIKNVKIFNVEEQFLELMYRSRYKLNTAKANNQFLSSSPRYLIEILIFSFVILMLTVFYYQGISIESIIPQAGVFGMAAYKMLPSVQIVFNCMVGIKSHLGAFDYLREDLSEALKLSKDHSVAEISPDRVEFSNALSFDQVCFSYPGSSSKTLNDFSLEVKKGKKIAFVGSTGSGKTTVLNMFLGFLKPTSGKIYIDEKILDDHNLKAWQQLIGYVPQDIFLMDVSIAENIAFESNQENICFEKLRAAAKLAEIDEFVMSLPEGYQTIVGEMGVQLSGGQRQRIGIARALYRNPKVLILDEATSALDSQTESNVMGNIYQMEEEVTVIIVAHRLSTIRSCDEILVLENGKIKDSGTYNELEEKCEYFKAMLLSDKKGSSEI